MIIYYSGSLNSKKNGGSSTSGYEFLQFLRIHYGQVILLTNDNIAKSDIANLFYGFSLTPLPEIITLKRKPVLLDKRMRSYLRLGYYIFKDFFKKKSVDLGKYYEKDKPNVLFINSWTDLFDENVMHNMNLFKKVCIVRGSPESFIWQSVESDKNEAINNAALFLDLFDILIYVSNNGLNDWQKYLSRQISSYYLPNSINENEINEIKKISTDHAKETLRFSKDECNIVVVGSVQKRKAQDILLKIINKLVSVIPNVKIHIVGIISTTWGGEEIYSDIMNSPYKKYFLFHGHSDNPLLFMQASDILLFTSYAEAFPRTVAEYMAIGKPIVAANVSGVNEMIIHGENGFLYDPFFPEQIIEQLAFIINNPIVASKISENAVSYYYNNFSKKRHIQRAAEIFSNI